MKKRWAYLCERTPGFLPAYAFDPKYSCGAELSAECSVAVDQFFSRLCSASRALYPIFMQFRRLEGVPDFHMGDATDDALAWWHTPPPQSRSLRHMALRIMSLSGTATETERNWKDFDHVVSVRRNRLQHERARMLDTCADVRPSATACTRAPAPASASACWRR